jgi:hypothetical protein
MHSLLSIFRSVSSVVAVSALLANCLPKSTAYDNYPRFKKFYEAFIVNTVAAVALNLRRCMPSLDLPAPFLGFHATPPEEKANDNSNNLNKPTQ